jgi:hypothetical protein
VIPKAWILFIKKKLRRMMYSGQKGEEILSVFLPGKEMIDSRIENATLFSSSCKLE